MTEISSEDKTLGSFLPWGFPNELFLCDAARQSDIKALSKSIANGVNPDFIDGFGKTAVHYAAANGSYESVKLLVANKASVNIWDANGTTPLHLAAKGNHPRVVKFLLMSGADVNRQCRSGVKPIDLAIYNSETWNVLLNAENGDLPKIEHLIQTRTVPLIPQFAIQREIDKQAKMNEQKNSKKSGKKKSGKKSGKGKKKKK
uniref:Ankyrin,domain-containing protein n=1 Tax=Schistosoma japonicum TaxID=6182 RepID=C1LJ64_SCHJA|nr:Ankyrin,domain-containing protein [Schistosoma japonicum]